MNRPTLYVPVMTGNGPVILASKSPARIGSGAIEWGHSQMYRAFTAKAQARRFCARRWMGAVAVIDLDV